MVIQVTHSSNPGNPFESLRVLGVPPPLSFRLPCDMTPLDGKSTAPGLPSPSPTTTGSAAAAGGRWCHVAMRRGPRLRYGGRCCSDSRSPAFFHADISPSAIRGTAVNPAAHMTAASLGSCGPWPGHGISQSHQTGCTEAQGSGALVGGDWDALLFWMANRSVGSSRI